MKKIKQDKTTNRLSNYKLGNSLLTLFGLKNINDEGEFLDLINCAGRVDKAVIYCPVSLGDCVFCGDDSKNNLSDLAPLTLKVSACEWYKYYTNVLSIFLSKKVTKRDLKGELNLPTIFDTLDKYGKKSLIITSGMSKMRSLLKYKPVDVLNTEGGAYSINKALSFIKEDKYDLIYIIDSDYDDCIKLSNADSKASKKVIGEFVKRFELLNDAIEVYYRGNVLLGFVPDKGCHKLSWLYSHGKSADDLNITHYYNVKEV